MPNVKRAHLTVKGRISGGTTIRLTGRLMVLGRHPDSDMVITDPTVSRRHVPIADIPRASYSATWTRPTGPT